MRRRPVPKKILSDRPPGIVRLWMLRALVPLGGARGLADWEELASRQLSAAIGIEQPGDEGEPTGNLRQELAKLHRAVEKRADRLRLPGQLARNLAMLGETIGLSDVERQILGFVALLHTEPSLEEAVTLLGPLSATRLHRCLAVLLGINERRVRASLTNTSGLIKSGLLSIDSSGSLVLRMKLEFPSHKFAESILHCRSNLIDLLHGSVYPVARPELTVGDFSHINDFLVITRLHLRQALKTRRQGVNVLVYGPPGTGKSQFARVMAADLKCNMYEVSSEDEEGDGVGGERRLQAYRASQHILSTTRALIVFDEAEDVFMEFNNPFGHKNTTASRKGWINRALERNPVPTIWISNSCRHIDPAFVRRFDIVMEMTVPPRRHRKKIARQVCGGIVSDSAIRVISDRSDLAPAIVARAASVIGVVSHDLTTQTPDDALLHLIEGTLQAQGKPGNLKSSRPYELPVYDPALINAQTNARKIVQNLSKCSEARLCLYGPPGTGKTAFSCWIAEQLDAPIHVKRASDLMSMWVGENEKNVAKAFAEAERERAVLLIDEIDSFLPDRHGTRYGWEARLVNEMLTQMESFGGIFIATTNRPDVLDQASLRRFDLKLEFGYLTGEQSLALLSACCRSLDLEAPSDAGKERLSQLEKLTPGDYGAVARRSRFAPIPTGDAWVEALEAECALKEGPRARMGFCR